MSELAAPIAERRAIANHLRIYEALHSLKTEDSQQQSRNDVAGDQASVAGSLLWQALSASHDTEALESPLGSIEFHAPAALSLHSSDAVPAPWATGQLQLRPALLQAAQALSETLHGMAHDARGQEAIFLRAVHETAQRLLFSETAVASAGQGAYGVHAASVPHAAIVEGLQSQLRTAVRMLGHVAHAWQQEAAAVSAARADAAAAASRADSLAATLDAIGIDTIVARAAQAEEEADASGRRVARRNTELKQHLRSARRRLALLHREVDELRNMKGQAGRITARFANLEHQRRREVGVHASLPAPPPGGASGALARHPDVPLLSLGVNSLASSVPPSMAQRSRQADSAMQGRSDSRRSGSSTAGSGSVSFAPPPAVLPTGGGAAAHYAHHIQNAACVDADALLDERWASVSEGGGGSRGGAEGKAAPPHGGAALQATLAAQTGESDTALTRMQSRLFGQHAAVPLGGGDDVLAAAGSVQLTSLWLSVAASSAAGTQTPAGAPSGQFLLEDSHRVGALAADGRSGGEGAVLLRALQHAFNDALTELDGAGSSTYRPLLGKTRRERALFVGELTELLAEWRQLVLHEFPKVADQRVMQPVEGGTSKGVLSLETDSIAIGGEGGVCMDPLPPQYLHPDFQLLAWKTDGAGAAVGGGAGTGAFQRSKHSASGRSWRGGVSVDTAAAWELFEAQQLQVPAQPRDITLAAAVSMLHECMCAKLAQEQAEADARVRVVEATAKARATQGPARPPSRASSAQSTQSPRGVGAAGGGGAGESPPLAEEEGGDGAFAVGEIRAAFRVTLLPFSVFWYEWLSLQYVLREAVASVAHSVLSVLEAAPSTPHATLLLGALGGGLQEAAWKYFMLQITRLRQLDVQPSATKNLSVVPTALYPAPLTPGLRGWVRDFTATCADPKEPSWSDLYNYLAYTICTCPHEEPRVLRCATSLAAVDRSGVGLVPFPLAADTLQRLAGRWHRSAQAPARELLPALFVEARQRQQMRGTSAAPAGWLQRVVGDRAPVARLVGERTAGRPEVDTAGAVAEGDGGDTAGDSAIAPGGAEPPLSSETAGMQESPAVPARRQGRAASEAKAQRSRFPELHIEALALQCAYCELLATCHDSSIRQAANKGSAANVLRKAPATDSQS